MAVIFTMAVVINVAMLTRGVVLCQVHPACRNISGSKICLRLHGFWEDRARRLSLVLYLFLQPTGQRKSLQEDDSTLVLQPEREIA